MPQWVIIKENEMTEIEHKLDDLLARLEKVLAVEDMEILRYACGKGQSKDVMKEVFIDFGKIFGETRNDIK